MSDKRRKFTPEFRAEAVKLVIDTGRPIFACLRGDRGWCAVAGSVGATGHPRPGWQRGSAVGRFGAGRARTAPGRECRSTVGSVVPEKSRGLLRLRSEPAVMFALIDAEKTNYSITRMI